MTGRNDVLNAPVSHGLCSLSQNQDLNVGVPFIQKNLATGKLTRTIGVERMIDLATTPFAPFPTRGAGVSTTINGESKLQFEFPSTENVEIFRVRAQ